MSHRCNWMSDTAAILRDVYGHGAAKKIARRFNVAVRTSKAWLAGRFPETRTQELTAAIREELDKIDARHSQIRKQLGLGSGGVPETRSEVGSGEYRDGLNADGIPAVAAGDAARNAGGETQRVGWKGIAE